MAGLFITFEGPEGSGKSTQAELAAEYLQSRGMKVLLTREPGGTPVGERIRDILLDPCAAGMTATCELFLFLAGRAQHVEEAIRPALGRGEVVVCSRYADASVAYQAAGRGLDKAVVERLNEWATGGLLPDLTIVLDVQTQVGLQRARAASTKRVPNGEGDRIERADIEFHRRVREGYLRLARENPERVKVVEADGLERMTRRVREHIDALLQRKGRHAV